MICISQYVNINNSRQNVLKMYTDESNPVLLILHGGPGSPDRPLVKKYNSALAEHFTVICWDQRGSGLSYCSDELSVDLMLSDLNELVKLLCREYRQDKIYIAGHSWGAYLGLRYVRLHPDKVAYYVGTGQGISSNDEIYKYEFAMQRAKQNGDRKVIEKLSQISPPKGKEYKSNSAECKKYVSKLVHKYGGYIHPESAFNMNEYLSLYLRCYKQKTFQLIKGISYSLKYLENDMLAHENVGISRVDVPIKIIMGEQDYVCPIAETKKWYDKLSAPSKEFVTIKKAAHMVNFEQPESWNKELLQLLQQEG